MSDLLSMAITATLLLYTVAMGIALARLFRGPSAGPMLAMDFIYVIGMLVMLVLAHPLRQRDVFRRCAPDGAVRIRRLGGDGQVLLRGG